VRGGKEAAPGRITVLKKSGDKEILYKSKAYPLHAGDAIIVETGGGGGYGPPSERARELVERDLRRGYISAKAATPRLSALKCVDKDCAGTHVLGVQFQAHHSIIPPFHCSVIPVLHSHALVSLGVQARVMTSAY
jgi:hypothetical protein